MRNNSEENNKRQYRVNYVRAALKKISLGVVGVTLVSSLVYGGIKLYADYQPWTYEQELKNQNPVATIPVVVDEFYILDGTNLRLEPGTDSKVIGVVRELSDYHNVRILNAVVDKDGNEWLLVRVNNQIGYISSDLCANLDGQPLQAPNLLDASGFVQAIGDKIHIRLNPWVEDGNQYPVTIKKGEYAKVIGYVNGNSVGTQWFLVVYQNNIGFVNKQFFTYYPDYQLSDLTHQIQVVAVQKDNVYLRTEPDKNNKHNINRRLANGTTLVYLGEEGDFYKVNISGSNKTYYVAKECCSLELVNGVPSSLQFLIDDSSNTKTM